MINIYGENLRPCRNQNNIDDNIFSLEYSFLVINLSDDVFLIISNGKSFIDSFIFFP